MSDAEHDAVEAVLDAALDGLGPLPQEASGGQSEPGVAATSPSALPSSSGDVVVAAASADGAADTGADAGNGAGGHVAGGGDDEHAAAGSGEEGGSSDSHSSDDEEHADAVLGMAGDGQADGDDFVFYVDVPAGSSDSEDGGAADDASMSDGGGEATGGSAADSDAPPAPPALAHGCKHYRRRCSLVAPCCGEVFPCRVCHDEAKNEAEDDFKKAHTVDRHAVKQVVCSLCDLRQPSAQVCIGCGVTMGEYWCGVCNLFDDEGVRKGIYHCDGCGMCRVGGRDNFFHCDTCGGCFGVGLRDNHVCREEMLHADCPICLGNLFMSRSTVMPLRCGHWMHRKCYRKMLSTRTTCPLCSKSVVDTTAFNQYMDMQIAAMPMPSDYADFRLIVLCNECHHESTVPFHILGAKCGSCGSYNTKRIGQSGTLPEGSDEAAADGGGVAEVGASGGAGGAEGTANGDEGEPGAPADTGAGD